MKNPTLAAALSIITGFGQIYNGQSGKGVALLMLQAVSVFLIAAYIGYVTTPLLWIYGLIDAFKTAKRMNESA